MRNNRVLLLFFALMIFTMAACTSAKGGSVTTPTEASSEKPADLTTIAAPLDLKPNPAPPFPTGRFVSEKDKAVAFQYNPDGTFEFYFAGQDPVFVGNYTVDGDQITTVNPGETDPWCIGEATYQWLFDGEKLTFAPIGEDPCKPRRDANADTYHQVSGSIPEIKIDAADFSYRAPDTVSAGWVRVILTNSGTEPHHIQFLRVNDGVSVEQFEQTLKQAEGLALALTQQVGGVGAVAPSGSAQAVINLPAGQYVILCLVPSPSDHTPHHAKGMIKTLAVQPAMGAAADEPASDLTVRMMDFAYDLPAVLPAGPMTIKVVNDGPEPHEFNFFRLADGKTFEDVTQYLAAPDGPPPFIPVGGMNGLDKGLSGYLESDLQPGNYIAICNIPSPKAEGHPHFTLGMIKPFSVTSPEANSFPDGKFISLNDKAKGYQFDKDGSFAYYLGGKDPVVKGNYTVVGDLLSVINPTETDAQCQGSVTYKWSFDGEKLTFAPIGEDTCKPRRDSFGDTYIRPE